MKQQLTITTCFVIIASVTCSKHRFISSTFVPPAAPTLATNSPASIDAVKARKRAVATGYVVPSAKNKQRGGGPLFAKKKKAPAGKKKVQVKLLKYVEGTGRMGDIVMVAPAFYENMLKKTGSGILITDDEVEKESSEKAAKEKAQLDLATDLKSKIEDISLVIPKKVGKDGHLFGAVGKKVLFNELKSKFPKGALGGKQVKILEMKDEEGKSLDHDIKETGEYTATISLLKDMSADFKVSVVEE
eukprot:CAMPEP_0185729954 /NCGR_PEP_ID=MMETSP1171-20130828/7790_1 /TAXON_ID=374046 /ORGANISM="Helicotheca tamensis, Strain CCMP826" /LENGTH=244 /DNA_ID=CAMNT_0028398905 /DNA_START=89 /DNA_END=823 /DNA_ORIENTATION=+